MTEEELHRRAALQRPSLSYSNAVFFDHEVAVSVWGQNLQGVSKGEAEGPFNLSDIDADIPLSRRFGVRQGEKVRCLDDFSWSGINAASQPTESPHPHTLDVVAAMMGAVMGQCTDKVSWLARSFDLKNAYTDNVLCTPVPSDF